MAEDIIPTSSQRTALYGKKVSIWHRGVWPKACAVSLIAPMIAGGICSDYVESKPLKFIMIFSLPLLMCVFWFKFMLGVRFELRELGLFYSRGQRRFSCLYTEIKSTSAYKEGFETTIAISLTDGTAHVLDGIGSGSQAFRKLERAVADGRLKATLSSGLEI